jgi:putative ABC transport system substrate-binding protein
MQFTQLRRRELITLLGGGAAWPLVARAQQPAMPLIGLLEPTSPSTYSDIQLRGFRQGLKDTGYVEGENVAIESHWAENQLDRLPELAAELVRRRAAAIAGFGPSAAQAAKAATTTIPIIFLIGDDPVKSGLVTSLARPSGNLTGVNIFLSELAAKRLELLREMVPMAVRVALLIDPSFPLTESLLKDAETAARAMGYNSKSTTLVPATRSMQPLQHSSTSSRTPSSSAPVRSSIADECNWSI